MALHATFIRVWNSQAPGSAAPVALFAAAYAVATETLRASDRRARPAPRRIPGAASGPRPEAAPGERASAADDPVLSIVDPRLVPEGSDLERQQELAGLVWLWASRLKRRDYALLDLHLRHGLTPVDAARALRIRPGSAASRLAGLAAEAQEAVGPAVLARRTPVDCPVLEVALYALPDDTALPAASRVVRAHLGRCALCQATRARLPSPMALLATMAPVPLDQHRREELWAGISLGATAKAARPRARPSHHRARPDIPRPVALTGIAAGVVVVLLGAALAGSDGGEPAADVSDPANLASASHVVGASSPRSTVTVTWSRVANAEGFSVRWSQGARDVPDRVPDLSGSATQSTSGELTPGQWWFHLRALSPSGRWTGATHLGPFVITQAATTTTTIALPSTTTSLPPVTRPTTTTTLPPVTVPTLPPTTQPPSTQPPTTTTTTVRPPTTTTTVPPPTTTTTTLPPTTTTTVPPTTSTTVPPTTTTTAPPVTLPPPSP